MKKDILPKKSISKWIELLPAHLRTRTKRYFEDNIQYEQLKNYEVETQWQAVNLAIPDFNNTDEGAEWWWRNLEYITKPGEYNIKPAKKAKEQAY